MEQTNPDQIAEKPAILVVDSDLHVLACVSVMLQDAGLYDVLTAASGEEAIQLAGDAKSEIRLLLAGFQMAEMSGITLATKLTAERPSLKVLMMSEFPDGTLVLNEGWHFLARPFVSSQLNALVKGLVYPDTLSRFDMSAHGPGPGVPVAEAGE